MNYKVVAFSVAREMGITLNEEWVNDIISGLWESHERFLDKVNGQGRDLTSNETKELANRLNLRAKYAIIDLIRFRTWRNRCSIEAKVIMIGDSMNYEQTYTTEDTLINNIDLSRKREYFMIKEYSQGRTMKEIGEARNVSEAWISQVFSKLKSKGV